MPCLGERGSHEILSECYAVERILKQRVGSAGAVRVSMPGVLLLWRDPAILKPLDEIGLQVENGPPPSDERWPLQVVPQILEVGLTVLAELGSLGRLHDYNFDSIAFFAHHSISPFSSESPSPLFRLSYHLLLFFTRIKEVI